MNFRLLDHVFLLLLSSWALALEFTIFNGQIFTPGFAILDAPQPGTPLGGDLLEVALDVTANGKLMLPPYDQISPSQIFNITIFMYSYDNGRNFTISNGTASFNNASLGDIMAQEPGSTVKHVKWNWPACLVGDGEPRTLKSDRGIYNISIRQNFRLNGRDHYTIFDVPISVTNKIDFTGNNPPCDELDNPLLSPEQIDAAAANNATGVLFAPGDATKVQQSGSGKFGGDGLGPERPEAFPEDGLGSGAGVLSSWNWAVNWVAFLSAAFVFVL